MYAKSYDVRQKGAYVIVYGMVYGTWFRSYIIRSASVQRSVSVRSSFVHRMVNVTVEGFVITYGSWYR